MYHVILFLPVFAVAVFWLFSYETAIPLYFFILGLSLLIYATILKTRQVQTGLKGMLGKKGLVIKDIDSDGKIQYATELWCTATHGNKFYKGKPVEISGIEGLMMLSVEEMPFDRAVMESNTCRL